MKGNATACLALADGSVIYGQGFGHVGEAVGELCFNTAMTGYQEIMTDPSYAGQIVTFTFPHIGNTGVTDEDEESSAPAALGMVVRERPTAPSNWRATGDLDGWMKKRRLIGFAGVDTRQLTRKIRLSGMQHAAICHAPEGGFAVRSLVSRARAFEGLENADLARTVTRLQAQSWQGGRWRWPTGFTDRPPSPEKRPHVVAVDYGSKDNILRCLHDSCCDVTVVPATADLQSILAFKPDGLFLSNGPGDPAATGRYAEAMIRHVIEKTDIPIFGICLGHQMIARALGARTVKMSAGHHGANHPVRETATGRVAITSMNHGFAVDSESLPEGVTETHVSLFDGTNCGLEMRDRAVFSVQYHPEASPGPHDSQRLFHRFAAIMKAQTNITPPRRKGA